MLRDVETPAEKRSAGATCRVLRPPRNQTPALAQSMTATGVPLYGDALVASASSENSGRTYLCHEQVGGAGGCGGGEFAGVL
jgi:hypothetical protein